MESASRSDPSGSVSTRLGHAVHQAIADQGGWLAFDQFMALVLYAPNIGYYANASIKFGALPSSGSDFITAPEMSPYFGRALAAQVAQALQACGGGGGGGGGVTEFGAGSGALAEQLIDALAGLGWGDVPYRIIDVSGELMARQRARLARFGERVQWLDAWPDAIDGAVICNEVLDAMPVQLLHFDGQHWFERGVSSRHGGFAWHDRPTELRPLLDAPFVPGTTVEIHPQALAWTQGLAQRLRCGVAILIDYGFPEAEFYLPQRHGGTLMCHRAHRSDADPLSDVGLKDITAHVNFSAIAQAAQDAGCDVLGYTSQARLLLNCGITDLLSLASLPQRVMAQKLINEHEMGELFKVLMFARGCAFDPIGFSTGDRTHRL